jgi:hypothetical protein
VRAVIIGFALLYGVFASLLIVELLVALCEDEPKGNITSRGKR